MPNSYAQNSQRDVRVPFRNQLLNQQPVSLVGRPRRDKSMLRFPEDLRSEPILLPSLDSDIRVGFDRLLDLAGIRAVHSMRLPPDLERLEGVAPTY